MFLLVAFTCAFIASLIAFMLCREKCKINKNPVFPAVTGLCFGGANLFNTVLAGRLDSAVFFSVQNISTILLSTLLGIVLFKEKVTKKTAAVIILGLSTVILFSI